MHILLSETEARVLACLVEKELTTPEYYPLTLNALTNACNQKSNRDPVVQYDEPTVQQTLDALRNKGLVTCVTGAGMRVPKFRHNFPEKYQLEEGETAILCELMLRGYQTPGELRARAERMYPFVDLDEVGSVLESLSVRVPPLILKLPRQSGHKEQRYAHLLCGEIDVSSISMQTASEEIASEDRRIAVLELKIREIEAELQSLKKSFLDWKAQFD